MWFRAGVQNTSRLSRPKRVLMRTNTSSHWKAICEASFYGDTRFPSEIFFTEW
jgi:hypothetical protein